MAFGSKSKLLYSTAHIMTAFRVDAADVLVIYGDVGQTVEFAVAVGLFATVEAQGLSIKSRVIRVCFLLSLLVSISGYFPGSSNHQSQNHTRHPYGSGDGCRCDF